MSRIDAVKKQTKGANISGRRALGRGLSALMASTAVEVPVAREALAEKEEAPPVGSKVAETKAEAAQKESSAAKRFAPVKSGLNASFEESQPGKIATDKTKHVVASPPVKNVPEMRSTEQFSTEQFGTENLDSDLVEEGLFFLSIDTIIASQSQPRQQFNPEEISALAQSIKDSGLLQPILVRRIIGVGGQGVNFEIVAGERRFRAAKKAGLLKIPAILKQLSDREAFQLALVENVQRSDLNAIEEAKAHRRLAEEFGLPHKEIAQLIGKDRASVANSIRLLRLTADVQQMMVERKISAGHGRALLKLEKQEAQRGLAARIVREGLSVREAERLANAIQNAETPNIRKKAKNQAERTPETIALEDRLRRGLGTKVSLSIDDKQAGELRVHFYSQEELERILERLSV